MHITIIIIIIIIILFDERVIYSQIDNMRETCLPAIDILSMRIHKLVSYIISVCILITRLWPCNLCI